MRPWLPLILMLIPVPTLARAERVPVPATAQARLDAGDYQQALKLIEPVFDQCMAAPEPGDSCLDIMLFMVRTADASGNAQFYDQFLDLTLRYAALVLPPMHRELADFRAMKADRLFTAKDYPGAEALYRQVLAARRAATPVEGKALAAILFDIELTLSMQEKHVERLTLATERVAVTERIGDPVLLSSALARAGRAARENGRYAEAEAWQRRAATLDEQAGPVRREARMAVLDDLGLTLFDQRKLREARAVFVEALALAVAIEGEAGEKTLDLIGDIAIMDRELDDLETAEAALMRAIALADANPVLPIKIQLGLRSTLSTILARTGRKLEALQIMQRPIDRLMVASEREQADQSDVLQNYAIALVGVGRTAEAEPIARHILAVRKASLRADDPMIARAQDTLGYILVLLGRHAEALAFYIQAVELLLGEGRDDATVGRDDLLLNSLGNLASTLVTMGKIAEAEPFQTQAYDLSRKLFPPGSRDLATALNRWAFYRKKMGRCDGLDAAREALAIWAKPAGAVSPDRVVGDINLANYLRMCGGSAAEQRSYWRDAARYLLADVAQSTDFDARAAGVLRDRSIAFYGLVDANWQLANPAQ